MSQMIFVAHSGGDPNGAPVGVLDAVSEKTINIALHGTGEGGFTVNRHDAQAAWCGPGSYVRVYLNDTDGEPVFAFWLAEGGDTLLDQDEEGGEVEKRTGPGALAYLKEALVWPVAFAGGDGHIEADGWHWTTAQPARVLNRMLLEAQARGCLPDLTWDFDGATDSNGDPWPGDAADEFRLPFGNDLLQVATEILMTDLYLRMTHDLVLHAYGSTPGVDHSATIEFAKGTNIREAAERTILDEPLRSTMLVEGDNVDGEPVYRPVSDAGVLALLGRRKEGFFHYERTATNAVLDRVGQRRINELKALFDGPETIGVIDTVGQVALVDYLPGDIVALHIPDEAGLVHTPRTIAAVALVETEAGEYDPVLTFGIEEALGGAGGSGTEHTPPSPGAGTETPAALDRYALFKEDGSQAIGPSFVGDLFTSVPVSFTFGALSSVGQSEIERGVYYNIGWPYVDCGFVSGGAAAGRATREAWYRFAVDLTDDTLDHVRFDIAAMDSTSGRAVGSTLLCGIALADPTDKGQWTQVGTIDAAGPGTVYVPRSMLQDSGDGYCWFVLAPGWDIPLGMVLCADPGYPAFFEGTVGADPNDATRLVVATVVGA